ncbi:MAG: guanylate kinase [Pseudohongiellaceae bacterium]
MNKGTLYIITAPSGAGKTSLVKALVDSDSSLAVSISHTTRAKRTGEEDGVNYFFVSEKEFLAMIQRDEFLESAKVFGHRYGTSQHWVDTQLAAGIGVILELDWQGAEQIRHLYPESCHISILPPTVETLRSRLEKRAQDDQRTIEKRMQEAANEISHATEADYIVVNDEFDATLKDIQTIVQAHRLSAHPASAHAQRLTVKAQQQDLAPLLSSLTKEKS